MGEATALAQTKTSSEGDIFAELAAMMVDLDDTDLAQIESFIDSAAEPEEDENELAEVHSEAEEESEGDETLAGLADFLAQLDE